MLERHHAEEVEEMKRKLDALKTKHTMEMRALERDWRRKLKEKEDAHSKLKIFTFSKHSKIECCVENEGEDDSIPSKQHKSSQSSERDRDSPTVVSPSPLNRGESSALAKQFVQRETELKDRIAKLELELKLTRATSPSPYQRESSSRYNSPSARRVDRKQKLWEEYKEDFEDKIRSLVSETVQSNGKIISNPRMNAKSPERKEKSPSEAYRDINHQLRDLYLNRLKRSTSMNHFNVMGLRLRLFEDPLRCIGAYVQPAAVVLAKYMIAANAAKMLGGLEDAIVVELGCGVGLVGIVAALSLRPKTITLTDCDERSLDLCRRNVDVNCKHLKGQTDCMVTNFRWGGSARLFARPVSLVMCSDVFYDRDCIEPLFKTLRDLGSARTIIVVAYQRRSAGVESAFLDRAKQGGFKWQHQLTVRVLADEGRQGMVPPADRKLGDSCGALPSARPDVDVVVGHLTPPAPTKESVSSPALGNSNPTSLRKA